MRHIASPPLIRQCGMVLITTLLLLIVVTLLALGMFHGVGLQARIAGNVMDKQRALHAANTAQQYAEQWLVGNVSTNYAAVCSSTNFSGATAPVICSNTLAGSTDGASASTVPWQISSKNIGYSYAPTNGGTPYFSTTSGTANSYSSDPVVYIAQLGIDATASNAVDYQIDAWSYAGAASTVAVVESIYQIQYISRPPGP